jgi:hypothetical protein
MKYEGSLLCLQKPPYPETDKYKEILTYYFF